MTRSFLLCFIYNEFSLQNTGEGPVLGSSNTSATLIKTGAYGYSDLRLMIKFILKCPSIIKLLLHLFIITTYFFKKRENSENLFIS